MRLCGGEVGSRKLQRCVLHAKEGVDEEEESRGGVGEEYED